MTDDLDEVATTVESLFMPGEKAFRKGVRQGKGSVAARRRNPETRRDRLAMSWDRMSQPLFFGAGARRSKRG